MAIDYNFLDSIKAEVYIKRDTYSYSTSMNKCWFCSIKAKVDGMSVETSILAETYEAATDEAYNKFRRVAEKGIPLPLLAAPVEHEPLSKVLDDDIPF